MIDVFFDFVPALATIAGVIVGLYAVNRLLERADALRKSHKFRNQWIMIGLTGAGLLAILVALPITTETRGQLLGLIGILLSAAIALSSTTVLGGAMAGVMLRTVRNFRMGDFIQVGEYFGRVSERGLFHTEIQTEDSNLTTLWNLYLVSHPVTTIRSSSTIVSAQVSLGYDAPRDKVQKLLLNAARRAKLGDPFVQIRELGDFSVTYRVCGVLDEVKQLLTARTRLHGEVMDSLHEGGVEIVSPTFMNTRALSPKATIIPESGGDRVAASRLVAPEAVVFDKAEEAESIEALRLQLASLTAEVESTQAALKEADEADRERLERDLSRRRDKRDRLAKIIAAREARAEEN